MTEQDPRYQMASVTVTGGLLCVDWRDSAYNSGGQTRWYAATMPVIRVDVDGNVCGVRCNERQITPLEVAPAFIEPAYRALKHLFEILYDPQLRLTLALQAGVGLLFNNQRMLHGRTAF